MRMSRRAVLSAALSTAVYVPLSRFTPPVGARNPDAAQNVPGSLRDLAQNPSDATPVSPTGLRWRGHAGVDGHLRLGPDTEHAILRDLVPGEPVEVLRWVAGEEVETQNPVWAEIESGHFVYSTLLRSEPVAGPPPISDSSPTSGRWIDVNLTLEILTAYEARTPIHSYLASTGRPGWDTPIGQYPIIRRVENETMDGPDYHVPNVLWTQYFTNEGHAIHGNYWRDQDTFGMPGSHGCVSLPNVEAGWIWDFATVGTPVVIHR